jgi:uncharacterized membrane protein (UPF0127 family)
MTIIRDIMTDATLADEASLADSFWAKFRGWMLRSRPGVGEGLIIQPCTSIHMMFMRFTIDAVFFDKQGRVTRVSRALKPWIGLAFGGRGAYGVVELPVGAAEGVSAGDQLTFDGQQAAARR